MNDLSSLEMTASKCQLWKDTFQHVSFEWPFHFPPLRPATATMKNAKCGFVLGSVFNFSRLHTFLIYLSSIPSSLFNSVHVLDVTAQVLNFWPEFGRIFSESPEL